MCAQMVIVVLSAHNERKRERLDLVTQAQINSSIVFITSDLSIGRFTT